MSNRLTHEQSPYLLQHAHNPVDWYPWGDEAFEKARSERKPVIVSIGYSACHWCHVMERESFEDERTAAYMNEHFVCIKVDREEYPDVDVFFMDAVQAISGSGGWPLNVFATPERLPFYGGTYFPPQPAYNRPSWMQVLQRIHEVWDTQHGEVKTQSEEMIKYLSRMSEVAVGKGSVVSKEDCEAMAAVLLGAADQTWGGFGAAPKFLGTMALSFLIEHAGYFGNEQAMQHAMHSLDRMIAGGIYDQLGGGFSRYSTDRYWLAPHFEKMLYDNALMILVLCDAYRATKKGRYREVIEETIGFVNRELRNAAGGFCCALDADSEGVEGKFYTWSWEAWQLATEGGNPFAEAYFGIEPGGNWEGVNILHEAAPITEAARHHGIQGADATKLISELKQRLFQIRAQRIRPATDDKCLLSWNALMNSALIKAGKELQNEHWLQQAMQHMNWMKAAFRQLDGTWMRVWKSGQARIAAQLEDLAFLAEAMTDLGVASGEHEWIIEAGEIVEQMLEDFRQEESSFFYSSSSAQRDIPLRKVEVTDGVMPSANAMTAGLLQTLGMLLARSEWSSQSEEMMSRMVSATRQYPMSFSKWGILIQRWLEGPRAVVVCGRHARKIQEEISKQCPPHAVVVTSQKAAKKIPLTAEKYSDADSLIFVCSATACLPAVSAPEDALRLLK